MKLRYFSLLFVVACSSTEDSPPATSSMDYTYSDSLSAHVRTHVKSFDTAKGGLQFTLIAYDQTFDSIVTGRYNEWIELRSAKPYPTHGWKFNAGDSTQTYSLPDTVFKFLRIYTKAQAGMQSKYETSLNLNQWVWNNSQPDTAVLYDETGKAVDTLTYK